MSFWDNLVNAVKSVGNAINEAAKAAGDAVNAVVNAVGEVVSDVVETIGNGVSDGLEALGSALKDIPVVGEALEGAFHWLGNIVASLTDLCGAVIKGATTIVGGVISGVIKVVIGGIGGLLAWDGRVFVEGWGDILGGIAGGVIGIVGKAIAVVQTIFGLQWGKRALTDKEKKMLTQVFRNSVALYNVRVVDGFAGLYSVNDRPFTLGNTIYMKNVLPPNYNVLLVHECTHVWQYQNLGYKYTMEAVWAQWTVPSQGYNWQDEFERGNTRWHEFNREAQAKFIDDVWRLGRSGDDIGNGVFYTDDPIGTDVRFLDRTLDRTKFAKDSIAYMRSFIAIRLSNIFS
jgi:hypothetical protein